MNERKFSWGANIVYVLATLALIFTLTVCSKGAGGTAAPGISHEVEVYASPDPITVKVTVLDGKITGGEIISESETALAFPAVTTILAQAVKNSNADNLDVVAGATASSNAAIETLQALLVVQME